MTSQVVHLSTTPQVRGQAVVRLTGQLEHNPRPLRTVKDVAYAWRQMIFFLSLSESEDPRTVLDRLREDVAAAPGPVSERLAPALAGLGYVPHGGRFDGDRTPGGGRRLLGWTTTRHWLLV
ncbi:hypothetical protein AB0J82_14865 [Asanoa sp. NPDC049518]|uniref:hypothetical protein n=1 Tax=unclassified Asanoa TaxID=2685164 RepID=UPI00341D3CC9